MRPCCLAGLIAVPGIRIVLMLVCSFVVPITDLTELFVNTAYASVPAHSALPKYGTKTTAINVTL